MATFRNGQEVESGTIRRDPARVCGRRDDPRTGEEAWRASPDGAASHREREPAGTQKARTETTEIRAAESGDRRHAGSRRAGAAETKAHCASHLDAAGARAAATPNRRSDGAPLCAAAQTRAWAERPHGVRATELRTGPGSAGRLVRGGGEAGRRTLQAAVFRDAQHGNRQRLPPRLP